MGENYNGLMDSDQNGSQFKVYLLTIGGCSKMMDFNEKETGKAKSIY